ncbi:MAG: L-2-amino-thiazoline-4-carboxylic acid hydrolase [Candidatus Acetothermia bacterium]
MSTDDVFNPQCVDELRAAIQHRATWMYLLIDEARKEGLNPEGFARRAITRCGRIHGNSKFDQTTDLENFAAQFASGSGKSIFEMEVIKRNPERFIVDFHHCPLVDAWSKLTDDQALISQLCDIAMDGDRGIINQFPNFKLDIEKTIAEGDQVCRLNISKSQTDHE